MSSTAMRDRTRLAAWADPSRARAASRRRLVEIEAVAVFIITFVVYFAGAGRSLGYDESVTVGNFVATPSVLDAFRRDVVLNNHPFFSFAEHVIYSLGGRTEGALRVLPIVLGAATVALLSWWCARRWTLLAGAAAAAVTASNPFFSDLVRQVRGYSLLAFCALTATMLFGRLRRQSSRPLAVAYVVTLGVGIATHLYGLLVLPVHAAVLASRRELSTTWVARWALAAVFGGLAYAAIVHEMWAWHGYHAWYPRFPLDLAQALLGMNAVTVVATALLVVGALRVSWPVPREIVAAVGVTLCMIAAIWLVLQPLFLYPRFLMFLVPAVGVLAARTVARWPLAAALAVVCVISTVIYEGDRWNEDPAPTRTASHILESAAAHGLRPCVLSYVGESLDAYRPPPFVAVNHPAQLSSCDVVMGMPGYGPTARARASFAYRTALPGTQSPMEIYSRVPISTLIKRTGRDFSTPEQTISAQR